MVEKELISLDTNSLEKMCVDSIELVKYARNSAAKSVNVIQTLTYYCIGKWIIEEQQKGEKRAKYGKQVLKQLSDRMNAEFGKGFSVRNLRNMRNFYLAFPIRQTLSAELGWSHYLHLIKIEDEHKYYLKYHRDNCLMS